MSWWKNLFNREDEDPALHDEDLQEARERRRELMKRLVVLGVEAEVLVGPNNDRRKGERRGGH